VAIRGRGAPLHTVWLPRPITGANAPGVPTPNYTGYVVLAGRKGIQPKPRIRPLVAPPVIAPAVPPPPITLPNYPGLFVYTKNPGKPRQHRLVTYARPVVALPTLVSVPGYRGLFVMARRRRRPPVMKPLVASAKAPVNLIGAVMFRLSLQPSVQMHIEMFPSVQFNEQMFPGAN
jgi:hypothetical protein